MHQRAPKSTKAQPIAPMSSNLSIPKTCQFCGKAFVAQKFSTKYCGHPCAARAYKFRMKQSKVQDALIMQQHSLQDSTVNKAASPKSVFNKEFLSLKETAQLLGASRWTIQRLIKGGKLSIGKIGRRTIIKRSDIDNLFK